MRQPKDKSQVRRLRDQVVDAISPPSLSPERLTVLADLADKMYPKTYEDKVRLLVIFALWVHEWIAQGGAGEFPELRTLRELSKRINKGGANTGTVKSWVNNVSILLDLEPPFGKGQMSGHPSSSEEEEDDDEDDDDSDESEDEPEDRNAPPRARVVTMPEARRLRSLYVAVIVVAALGAGAALGYWRGYTSVPASLVDLDGKRLRDVVRKTWHDPRQPLPVLGPADACKNYQGRWIAKASYVLDPRPKSRAEHHLIYKSQDVDFLATCESDGPNGPLRLVGTDVTTAYVVEKGHEDTHLAEVVNVVTARITFANDRPATRLISDTQRFTLHDFSRDRDYDPQLLKAFLGELGDLSNSVCTVVLDPTPSEMAFRCRFNAEVEYEKALTKVP